MSTSFLYHTNRINGVKYKTNKASFAKASVPQEIT